MSIILSCLVVIPAMMLGEARRYIAVSGSGWVTAGLKLFLHIRVKIGTGEYLYSDQGSESMLASMALNASFDPFREVLEDISESVAHFEFNQSSEHEIDYDNQFERAYDQFKDHEDKVYRKLNALLEADNSNENEKDSQKAVKFREAGNKYFKEEKFAEAMTCYDKSILFAPCPENMEEEAAEFKELALGLVNRNGAR